MAVAVAAVTAVAVAAAVDMAVVAAATAVAAAVATERRCALELFTDSIQKPTKGALTGLFFRLPLGVTPHGPEKHVSESYASDA
jgi:hypothetical protein